MTVGFSHTGRMVAKKFSRSPTTSSKPDLRRRSTEKALLELLRVDSPGGLQNPDFAGTRVNWIYLVELAYREGVAPLVYDSLSQAWPESSKVCQTSKLKYVYHQTQRRHAEASDQLAQVLQRFQSVGIKPLVLKGAALAKLVYPDPGLRPFADMDILVRKDDLEDAHRVLVELGYRHNYMGQPVPRPSDADVKYRSARQYFHQDAAYQSIDLYWQLGRFPHLFNIDTDKLWDRSCPVDLGGTSALTLAPDDEILHLALEFSLGIWYGHPEIRNLRDIAQIAQQKQVDWVGLASKTQRSSLSALLYYSCRLSREILGADIPVEFLERLHIRNGRLEDWITGRLARNLFGGGHPLEYLLLTVLMRLSGPEKFTGKAGWIIKLMIPPLPLWNGAFRNLKRVISLQTP